MFVENLSFGIFSKNLDHIINSQKYKTFLKTINKFKHEIQGSSL